MKKWHVIGFNECSNAGTFEAETAEDAERIAWETLNLTNCHQCPDTSGDPYFIVSDEDHNVVSDGSYYAAQEVRISDLQKENAQLKQYIGTVQVAFDELRIAWDDLKK